MRTAGLALALALLLVVACVPAKRDEETRFEEAPAPEASLFETVEGTLDRGETPMGWAMRHGVPRSSAEQILRALAVHVSASRYRTDDRLEVVRGEGGEVLSFTLERAAGERYVVKNDTGVWLAARETRPLRRELVHYRGTIRSSLWESLRAEGASPELVVRFADIFSWTFDFLTDCKRGDRFELLAEAFYEGETLRRTGDILVARYEGGPGTVAGVRFQPEGMRAAYYAPDGSSLQKEFLRSPLNYRRISSGFSRSRFHPVLKRYMPHLGIDYAAAAGTPVVTIGDGNVAFAGWKKGYGNCVEIRHNRSYATTYGHLSRIARGIRPGARVQQGEVIGAVGSTGLATGPHLDFRMRQGATFVNPLRIEIPSAEPVPAAERSAFFQKARLCLAALDVLPEGSLGPESDPMVLALLSGGDVEYLAQSLAPGDHPAP